MKPKKKAAPKKAAKKPASKPHVGKITINVKIYDKMMGSDMKIEHLSGVESLEVLNACQDRIRRAMAKQFFDHLDKVMKSFDAKKTKS